MQNKTRTEYATLNAITGIGGFVVNTVLGFICRMVFARVLSENYLGINGLFSNIISMLSLAELGVGGAIVYALYKPVAEENNSKIASLIDFYRKVYIAIGLVVGTVGISLVPFLHIIVGARDGLTENIYLIYLIYLANAVFSYFFSYRSAILQAMQRNYLITGINYIITIVQSIIQMIFLLLTKAYLSYLLIQLIGGMTYTLVISHVAKKEYPFIAEKGIKPLTRKEKGEIAKNVRYLLINKMANLFLSSTDNIIASMFSGLASVGFLSNYTLLSGTLNGFINQFFSGLTAGIGNFSVTENKDRIQLLFKTLNLANFWTFGWGAIGIYICCSDLIELCFGEKFVLSQQIVFAIALNFYIVGMLNAVWIFKNAMGLFKYGRYLLILTGIINIVASVYLGNKFGLFGILIATSLARGLTNAWYEPYALYKYGFADNPVGYLFRYIKFTIIILFTGLMLVKICTYISGPVLCRIIKKMIICSLGCNLFFLLMFRNTQECIILRDKGMSIIRKYIH